MDPVMRILEAAWATAFADNLRRLKWDDLSTEQKEFLRGELQIIAKWPDGAAYDWWLERWTFWYAKDLNMEPLQRLFFLTVKCGIRLLL